MKKVAMTYDPLALTRLLMQMYVEQFIQGKFYKAKQFACYDYLFSLKDDEIEKILFEFIEREKLELITYDDWKHDMKVIWEIISEKEEYKALEFKFKRAGHGETGLGVVDKSDNTFYDCDFAHHWQTIVEIVELKHKNYHKALKSMFFDQNLNEYNGITRAEVDEFILETFELVGNGKRLDDYLNS